MANEYLCQWTGQARSSSSSIFLCNYGFHLQNYTVSECINPQYEHPRCERLKAYCVQLAVCRSVTLNLLKSTGHVMHHQFNVQQLYALPTLYLCVLYLSENKQRLVPLTA